MIPEPVFSSCVPTHYHYWVFMYSSVEADYVFASFKKASDLLKWYEDGCVELGEQGISFSHLIKYWGVDYEIVKHDAEWEEIDSLSASDMEAEYEYHRNIRGEE